MSISTGSISLPWFQIIHTRLVCVAQICFEYIYVSFVAQSTFINMILQESQNNYSWIVWDQVQGDRVLESPCLHRIYSTEMLCMSPCFGWIAVKNILSSDSAKPDASSFAAVSVALHLHVSNITHTHERVLQRSNNMNLVGMFFSQPFKRSLCLGRGGGMTCSDMTTKSIWDPFRALTRACPLVSLGV